MKNWKRFLTTFAGEESQHTGFLHERLSLLAERHIKTTCVDMHASWIITIARTLSFKTRSFCLLDRSIDFRKTKNCCNGYTAEDWHRAGILPASLYSYEETKRAVKYHRKGILYETQRTNNTMFEIKKRKIQQTYFLLRNLNYNFNISRHTKFISNIMSSKFALSMTSFWRQSSHWWRRCMMMAVDWHSNQMSKEDGKMVYFQPRTEKTVPRCNLLYPKCQQLPRVSDSNKLILIVFFVSLFCRLLLFKRRTDRARFIDWRCKTRSDHRTGTSESRNRFLFFKTLLGAAGSVG